MTFKETLKHYTNKTYVKKYIVYLIAISMLGFGVALIFQTNFGNSAWDAFHKNLHLGLNIPFKLLYPVTSGIIVCIAYMIEKKKANVSMIIPVLLSTIFGSFVDLFLLFIPSVAQLSFLVNLVYFVIALLGIVIALNLIRYCQFPLAAIDQLCMSIAKRFKLSFGTGKLIGEIIAVVLSVLSGIIFDYVDVMFNMGVTTIFFILFLGILVDLVKLPIMRLMRGVPTVDLIADDLLPEDLVKKPSKVTSRAIIIHENQVLITYLEAENYYMLPGGEKKKHESLEHCLKRVVSNKTGLLVKIEDETVIVNEYFEHKTFINHYFICSIKNDRIEIEKQPSLRDDLKENIQSIWMDKDDLLTLLTDHDTEHVNGHHTMWREFLAIMNSL